MVCVILLLLTFVAQAKASQRLLSRELEESKLRRSREVNEYVFEDLQMHLSTLKERLNQEETEKKNLLSELKRVKYLHKKVRTNIHLCDTY